MDQERHEEPRTEHGNSEVLSAAFDAPSGFLDRAAIAKAVDVQTEVIDVPEWGGKLRVRGLTGKERDNYEEWILTGKGKNREVNARDARAKLIVLCVVDEKGERLLSTTDIGMLREKSAAALQRVFDAASRLSGLSDEELEELTEGFE